MSCLVFKNGPEFSTNLLAFILYSFNSLKNNNKIKNGGEVHGTQILVPIFKKKDHL